MTKEQFGELNRIAREDFEKAQSMLDGINMALGTGYDWVRRRVTFWVDGHPHDAYTWARRMEAKNEDKIGMYSNFKSHL